METQGYDFRSVSFWLKMPIVGPILCLALVFLGMAVLPSVLGGLLVWFLFAVGCLAVCMNLARAGRYLLRR